MQNNHHYNLFNETFKFIPNISNSNPPKKNEMEIQQNTVLLLSANRNLQDIGYTMSLELIEALKTQDRSVIIENYNKLYDFCANKTGLKMKNTELFYPNFPEEVMKLSDAQIYLNALIAYTTGRFVGENIRIHEEKQERPALIESFDRECKIINQGSEKDLIEMMQGRLFSGKVLPDVKRDELLLWMKDNNVWKEWIKDKDIPIKENKIVIAKYIHDNMPEEKKWLKYMLRDSVDILRYASAISKAPTNIELNGHVHFRLSKPDQREVKELLNNCKNLYKDIWTREGLFKSLGRACSMSKSVPKKLKQAYDNLAKGEKIDEKGREISTTWIEVEKALINAENKNYDNIEKFANNFPGLYQANFLALMQRCKDSEEFQIKLANLYGEVCKDVAPDKSFKMLNEAKFTGNIKPSGTNVKIYTQGKRLAAEEDKREPYSDNVIKIIEENVKKATTGFFKGMEGLNSYYIDPRLKNYKLPGNNEKDMSKGSNLTQGTRQPCIKEANLLSMAITWKQSCDIDAHMSFFDKDMNFKEECYYGNIKLKTNDDKVFAVHSGDFTAVSPQQRKNGGVLESVIIDKELCKKNGIRYVGMSIHGYSGETFKQSDCTIVTMQREGSLENADKIDKYEDNPIQAYRDSVNVYSRQPMTGDVYEAKTVDQCLELNTNATYTTPAIYDLEKDEMIWVDAPVQLGYCSGFEDLINSTEVNLLKLVQVIDTPKGNMYELFEAFANGVGAEIVDLPEKAEGIFSSVPLDAEKMGISKDVPIITANDLSIISSKFLTKEKKVDAVNKEQARENVYLNKISQNKENKEIKEKKPTKTQLLEDER